jgi:flagellar biosynthesis protein FliP
MKVCRSHQPLIKASLLFFFMLVGLCYLNTSFAQSLAGIPALTLTKTSSGEEYTLSFQILILMTLLTFLPAIILMMTSFTRIIVVFAILRQAIGLQQTPSNQVMIGLALFLSFFIMSPALDEAYQVALQPLIENKISQTEAIEKGLQPFKKFMAHQTRENDLNVFFKIAKLKPVANIEEIPIRILVPAFITSELKTAFQIGFLLFIPFLIIDLVVASVLMAMGMMMLSPMVVSLPFKIMLFVFVDGWAMITETLAGSFRL